MNKAQKDLFESLLNRLPAERQEAIVENMLNNIISSGGSRKTGSRKKSAVSSAGENVELVVEPYERDGEVIDGEFTVSAKGFKPRKYPVVDIKTAKAMFEAGEKHDEWNGVPVVRLASPSGKWGNIPEHIVRAFDKAGLL